MRQTSKTSKEEQLYNRAEILSRQHEQIASYELQNRLLTRLVPARETPETNEDGEPIQTTNTNTTNTNNRPSLRDIIPTRSKSRVLHLATQESVDAHAAVSIRRAALNSLIPSALMEKVPPHGTGTLLALSDSELREIYNNRKLENNSFVRIDTESGYTIRRRGKPEKLEKPTETNTNSSSVLVFPTPLIERTYSGRNLCDALAEELTRKGVMPSEIITARRCRDLLKFLDHTGIFQPAIEIIERNRKPQSLYLESDYKIFRDIFLLCCYFTNCHVPLRNRFVWRYHRRHKTKLMQYTSALQLRFAWLYPTCLLIIIDIVRRAEIAGRIRASNLKRDKPLFILSSIFREF